MAVRSPSGESGLEAQAIQPGGLGGRSRDLAVQARSQNGKAPGVQQSSLRPRPVIRPDASGGGLAARDGSSDDGSQGR